MTSITDADYQGKDALRKAPKGYWLPLPIAWAPGYGSTPKHPLGGKLTRMLVIGYTDDFGDAQKLVFANTTEDGLHGLHAMDRSADDIKGHELVNRIIAARARARRFGPASIAV